MNPTDAYRKELRKKELKRMIYMYLVQVLFSAMPPNNECGEEEEEGGLSEDSEREQEVWSEDINATQDGKEATKNCEDRVEEPKKRMTFFVHVVVLHVPNTLHVVLAVCCIFLMM
ncbi:uncharacterized protein LOC130763794 [Actinidia eriantha]|uniref:uncharacterized protein LOC130763794 n=1 Tax=Actinidia eriantha TaxID=165200 RepID=UPI0025877B84|nr:uncharacterized protein LOC130763794 [Actinidia eriantha]